MRDECFREGLRVPRGRCRVDWEGEHVGDGFDPVFAIALWQRHAVAHGLRRVGALHGADALPFGRGEGVEADVGGDAVEPGLHARALVEAVEGLPGAEHGLLDGVLGVEDGAEHAVAVAGEEGAEEFSGVGVVHRAMWHCPQGAKAGVAGKTATTRDAGRWHLLAKRGSSVAHLPRAYCASGHASRASSMLRYP